MVIEETIEIDAPLDMVWDTFADVACWKDWNTVLENEGIPEDHILETGHSYRWCLRPFSVPIHFEPVVEEVHPREKIVWNGEKLGIHARHEFSFATTGRGTTVTSRETFRGITPALTRKLFLGATVRKMTVAMLEDLKRAVESSRGASAAMGKKGVHKA